MRLASFRAFPRLLNAADSPDHATTFLKVAMVSSTWFIWVKVKPRL